MADEMDMNQRASLERVAATHEIRIAELVAANALAENAVVALRAALQQAFDEKELPGVEVVLVGSIARGQCTLGSDVDFYAVAERELPADVSTRIIELVLATSRTLGFGVPVSGGPMAQTVPRSQIETVSTFTDDLARVVRRMTLLVASRSLYRPALRAELLRNVLSSFIGRDREPRVRGVVDQVIRLGRLSNMIAEVRMEHRDPDGGLVSWAKAGTLYRIEMAASLAALFRAEVACAGRSREQLVNDLVARFDVPPLFRLLELYDDVATDGRDALATVVSVSNQSLRILGAPGNRERLAANDGSPSTEALRGQFEHLRQELHAALVRLFHHDPLLSPWIERLGVFD